VDYTVSKWGINGMVRHLSDELGQRGIRVNAVLPGYVGSDSEPDERTEAELAAEYSAVPLRRSAKPGEISALVEFLLSQRAAYITGALIPVSGGWV
jgi:NAD(P)-dependent dehydrogenase (short-subunit alcohol dehydrogenase family)